MKFHCTTNTKKREDDESDDTHFFYGPDCMADMFEHLKSITVDTDGADRGHCHIPQPERIPWHINCTTLLCQTSRSHRSNHCGNQVLSLWSDRLTFKDSLSKSFLPFPLANSPATFGITELCNGFFPHIFNTQENVYSTSKKTNIMKDPCHPKKCTIQMARRPKRKLNSNNGT